MDLWTEWQAGQEAPKARPYLRLADEDSAPPLTLEQLDSEATRCALRLLTAAKGRWRLTHDKETGAPVPSPAQPILYLSDDRMAAWIMIFPPVAGGAPAEIQDVRDAMDAYLVSSGIDEADLLPAGAGGLRNAAGQEHGRQRGGAVPPPAGHAE